MGALVRLNSFEEIAEGWQALLSSCVIDTVFFTPQWQKVWWQELGQQKEMLLLSFQPENEITGIAPLKRENGVISFLGDRDLYDYADFLVGKGHEDSFYSALLDYLEGEPWERLELFSLSQDSCTLTHLAPLARQRGYEVEVREEDVVPGLSLPESWDAYLSSLSRKDRHELRRKLRRLSSETEYRCYTCSSPDELDQDLESFFQLMADSQEAKSRFLTPERQKFFGHVAQKMASLGFLRLFFLELQGERVATVMCFDYGPVRFLYNSGFNPNYGYYSVGLLLKALCVKDAIENGRKYFDFLRGPEAYKYDLGATDRQLYEMVVKRS